MSARWKWGWLVIGSNQLDGRSIKAAVVRLRRRFSRVHSFEPAVFESDLAGDQRIYLNQLLLLGTGLPPRSVAAEIKQLERRAARRASSRCAPIMLDIDPVALEGLCGMGIRPWPGRKHELAKPSVQRLLRMRRGQQQLERTEPE